MPFGINKEKKSMEAPSVAPSVTSSLPQQPSVSSKGPTATYLTQIGSRTELVTSPDGKSVQLAPEQPKTQSPRKALLADSTTTSPIFRNDIRQEWINAMFGSDFFPNPDYADAMHHTPPKEGMGLAQIPSYLSYTATIVVPVPDADEDPETFTQASGKVGITMSRIPIAVYVRMVDIESEAFAAGIVPGSVLIDINGMGVLGEPSHKLLERLWVYEGHFAHIGQELEGLKQNQTQSRDDKNGNGNGNGNGISPTSINSRILHGPVSMTFIKDGLVYTTVLLMGAPFGISWAPCGNFALVQRAYSHAQKAGVRRGCIVAAVNHKSMREMDHLDTAMELKKEFTKGKDIRIVCIYTPAASRTNFKKGNASPSKNKANEFQNMGGVRVRSVNMFKRKQQEKATEYGVGSFFTCGTSVNYAPVLSGSDIDFISDLANRVAAGEVAAPTGTKRGLSSLGKGNYASYASFQQIMSDKALALQQSSQADENTLARSLRESEKKYNDCPLLNWEDVIPKWNYLDALILCLRMHTAAYNEESFIAMGGIIGGSSGKSALLLARNPVENGIVALHSTNANIALFRAIKAATNATEIIHSYLLQILALISSDQIRDSIEIKIDDAMDEDAAKKLLLAETMKVRGEMIDVIVDIALHDEDLCQTLHFLLRSFSSTYANQNGGDKAELLKNANIYLKSRLIERESSGVTMPSLQSPASVSLDGIYDYESLQTTSTISQYSYIKPSSSNVDKAPKKTKQKFGKKFGNIFKSKSKKSEDVSEVLALTMVKSEDVSPDSSPKLPSPSKPGSKKKLGFMPTSILRKMADQAPQDNCFIGGSFTDIPTTPELFENMGWFLSNLDKLCGNIERSLLKSFSQKITEWALQPWSANKDRALAESTGDMRNGLRALNSEHDVSDSSGRHWSPVLNPMDSSEMLVSIVPEESYILPSAHFPLLLSFNSCPNPHSAPSSRGMLHRVHVKVVSVRGEVEGNETNSYAVNAAVGGTIKATGRSALEPYYGSTTHRWHDYNDLDFESRLSNHPSTVEIKVSSLPFNAEATEGAVVDEQDMKSGEEVGFALVDISNCWKTDTLHKTTHQTKIQAFDTASDFDQSGDPVNDTPLPSKQLTVELEITTESILLVHGRSNGIDTGLNQRRMLLYKHDEDMRQEMLAIQFLNICDRLLKASGLDLKMKKYKCIPVGENKGFIEWVPGAISLSEICKPMGSSLETKTDDHKTRGHDPSASTESGDEASTKFVRSGAWCKYESLRSLRHVKKAAGQPGIGLYGNNPIQDFLRSNAYDADAPYFIQKNVMDNFVKSCAGYCVVTYLLGVGDRHTDNLLLHPEGYFLHCDYSFILGQDPKTFLPMRITEHMVNGMGGRDSDNFAKFLSLAGAAFVSLRQPASVRVLVSMIQGMLHSHIPDISVTQKPDQALTFIHQRFSLDLNDDDAVAFLEENIENSLTSKIWVAVDTLHSIGKRF